MGLILRTAKPKTNKDRKEGRRQAEREEQKS
jgi:hypothetical protein